jgi:hypothetical protein
MSSRSLTLLVLRRQRFVSITAAEGNMRSFRQGLEGETMISEYAPLVGVASLPNFVRSIVKKFLPPRVSHLLACGSKLRPDHRDLDTFVD